MSRFDRFRIVVVALWASSSLYGGSEAGISVYALLLVIYGGGFIGLVWIGLLVASLLRRKKTERLILLEPATIGIVLVLVFTGLAFRARFAASGPFLNHYVARLRSGGAKRLYVGLFAVHETEVLPGGVVRLITGSCMFDECGLAYSPLLEPPRVGEDTYEPLSDGWWVWTRSW
jgi:hypothetical protein